MLRAFLGFYVTLLLFGTTSCGLQVDLVKRYHRSGYSLDISRDARVASKHTTPTHTRAISKRDALTRLNAHKATQLPHLDLHRTAAPRSSLPTNIFVDREPNNALVEAVNVFAVDSPRLDPPPDVQKRGFLSEHPVPLAMLGFGLAAIAATVWLSSAGAFAPWLSWLGWIGFGLVLGSLSFILIRPLRVKHDEPNGSAAYHFYDFLNVLLLGLIWMVLISIVVAIVLLLLLIALFRQW